MNDLSKKLMVVSLQVLEEITDLRDQLELAEARGDRLQARIHELESAGAPTSNADVAAGLVDDLPVATVGGVPAVLVDLRQAWYVPVATDQPEGERKRLGVAEVAERAGANALFVSPFLRGEWECVSWRDGEVELRSAETGLRVTGPLTGLRLTEQPF